MKKIALFGGSGLTGNLFLNKALAAGFSVQALVRTPSKVTEKSPRLTILQGDVLNANDVANTIKGCDVVVSLFGHVKGSPEWLQRDGTKHIIEGMKQHGITKIISLSGGGLPYPSKDEPKRADNIIRFIMKIAVPKILNDAIAHHKVLEASNVKWIIARAPRLTNKPPKHTYRIGWVGVNGSTSISRADFADFLLTQIDDETFIHQMPFVSN